MASELERGFEVAALTQALMSFTFNYGNARNPMPRNSRPVSVLQLALAALDGRRWLRESILPFSSLFASIR